MDHSCRISGDNRRKIQREEVMDWQKVAIEQTEVINSLSALCSKLIDLLAIHDSALAEELADIEDSILSGEEY